MQGRNEYMILIHNPIATEITDIQNKITIEAQP